MLIDQIDEFLAKPNRHVAWHEEPYPINHSYIKKEKRWAIHEDGIDTGVMLSARYSTTCSNDEFTLALCLRHDFCRLDMRGDARAISLRTGIATGPIFFPWPPNREVWRLAGRVGKLSIHEPLAVGCAGFSGALNWFLLAHGIANHDIPPNLRLRR